MKNIVRVCMLAATVAVFATTSFAQDLKVIEKVLPNGLKVLLKEEHKAPVVTFQIWYKVGSRNERLGATGMSHLLEHMMFKGTKKYGPKTFSQTVQRNGGNDNAFTSKDYTAYFENFAADRIDISLELESDRIIRDALGDHIFDHFLDAKRAEWSLYAATVHDWELNRYLEIM